MPNYRRIQFIAYEIFTAPLELDDGEIYVGLPNDFDDIAARVAWTRKVLAAAAEEADTSPEVLKVLMLPEFYFRGSRGAYGMDIVAALTQALQDSIRAATWADWLVVFGTIIGISSPTYDRLVRKLTRDEDALHPTAATGTAVDPHAEKEGYNLALIQKGGWAPVGDLTLEARNDALENTSFVTMKEHKSGIDFIKVADRIDPSGYAWERVVHLKRIGGEAWLAGPQVGREERFVNYDGTCLFTMDDLRFGLEICLDHADRRLKNAPRPAGQPPVQIHLVPSCGMDLIPGAVVAMTGGFAFNVDGHNGSSSRLCQVTQAATLASPIALLGNPLDPEYIEMEAGPADRIDELFADGPGYLAVYAPVAIPGDEGAEQPPARRLGGSRR